MIHPNPALVSVRILTREPAIQGLLEVVQVLRLSIALSFCGTWIVIRQTLIIIQARPGHEPAVVAADCSNGIVAVLIELGPEVVCACVDVVLDRIRAYAVGIIFTGDLHQAWCWPTGVGLARGLLHGYEGKDGRVDTVAVTADLEVRVVLLAVAAGTGVEGRAIYVVHAREV